jgi:hypothetical protein
MNDYDSAAKVLGIIRATLSDKLTEKELDLLNNIVYDALEKEDESFTYYYSAQVLSTEGVQIVSDFVVSNQKLNESVIEGFCENIVEKVNTQFKEEVCNTDDVHIQIIKELDE